MASWCLSDLLAQGVHRITLHWLWKAIVMYWLPLQARLGSLLVLFIRNSTMSLTTLVLC
jgi:hypothetical protein